MPAALVHGWVQAGGPLPTASQAKAISAVTEKLWKPASGSTTLSDNEMLEQTKRRLSEAEILRKELKEVFHFLFYSVLIMFTE